MPIPRERIRTVIVFNDTGKPIAEYDSVKSVAEEYHTSPDNIMRYINTGGLWKKYKICLDVRD